MQSKIAPMRELRSQFNTWLGLLLLLLLTLAQFSSNGVMRGGGDEGSGIGGTGRTLRPTGESGIGGTGYKPFLGMNSEHEIEILRDPELQGFAIETEPALLLPPTPISPLSPPVARVMREQDFPLDSAAIDISVAIQQSLDVNARTLRQIRDELLQTASLEPVVEAVHTADAPADQVNWSDVATLLEGASTSRQRQSDTTAPARLANVDFSAEEAARIDRPERIQRPELPPLQRITPMQRTAILPPRVQPMRL